MRLLSSAASGRRASPRSGRITIPQRASRNGGGAAGEREEAWPRTGPTCETCVRLLVVRIGPPERAEGGGEGRWRRFPRSTKLGAFVCSSRQRRRRTARAGGGGEGGGGR
jgi:hypothetical protein